MSAPDLQALADAARAATESTTLELEAPAFTNLLVRLHNSPVTAHTLINLLQEGRVAAADRPALLELILDAHQDDQGVLMRLGYRVQDAVEINYLNAAAPSHPVFARIVEALGNRLENPREGDDELELRWARASAAGRCGRAFDAIEEAEMRRVLELAPNDPEAHYDFGLALKNRGRFAEGLEHNRRARELSDDPTQPMLWNLGICATGAREGATALEVWKELGQKVELGRLGLPDGSYPTCKVRLAQYPLAERGPERDQEGPGLEETIWVQRLSPCHGIVRSVLYQHLGVDYGDFVLFDGAPVTYHESEGKKVPVFPHLATLQRSEYNFFEFAGLQAKRGELEALSMAIPLDGVVYSHTEHFRTICKECWEAGRDLHDHDQEEEHSVVTGYVTLPPGADFRGVYDAIQSELRKAPHLVFACPVLAEAANYPARAQAETKKLEALLNEAKG